MNFMGMGWDGVAANRDGVGMGLMSTTVSLFNIHLGESKHGHSLSICLTGSQRKHWSYSHS